MDKRILAFDSQVLDGVQKCGFYTYLNFIKNYRQDDKPEPLERGGLGHDMLEVYYKLLQQGVSWDDAVEQATIVGRKNYIDLSMDLAEAEWTVKTFHQYAEYYRHDGLQIIGVEDIFSFVIHEDDELIIVYEGKIDLQCSLPNIPLTVVDHKFRKQKAEYSALDNQFIGYAIHADINIVYVNEVGMQKSYKPEDKFRRLPLMISDGVKQRWLKNTVQWAKVLDYQMQNNIWPQSHLKTAPLGITQCVKCPYQLICDSVNEEEMARKIQGKFHLGEKWDVGAKNEAEPIGEVSK